MLHRAQGHSQRTYTRTQNAKPSVKNTNTLNVTGCGGTVFEAHTLSYSLYHCVYPSVYPNGYRIELPERTYVTPPSVLVGKSRKMLLLITQTKKTELAGQFRRHKGEGVFEAHKIIYRSAGTRTKFTTEGQGNRAPVIMSRALRKNTARTTHQSGTSGTDRFKTPGSTGAVAY